MSSLLGDFPESPAQRRWRWAGYFVLGIFLAFGPVVFAMLLLAIHHVAPPAKSWPLALGAWGLCAAWTAHMGVNGRLVVPNRFFSLLVYLGYIFLGATVSPQNAARIGINLFFPMVCIWFGGLMGDYTGYMFSQPIDQRSPGVLIIFLGWCIILGAPVVSGLIGAQL